MKFSTAAALFTLAAGVFANPSEVEKRGTPVKRDLTTITNVVNGINSQAASFDQSVKSYNGGDISPLTSAAASLLQATQQGAQQVQGTSQVSESDALQIQPLVQTLTTTVNGTISDLIAKKQQLVSAGGGGQVESALTQQKSAAQDLSTAISSKVPQELQSLAQQLSSGILNSLQNGIDAFQGTGGSASGSGSASAGPTSTASSSSAPQSTASSTAKPTGSSNSSSPAPFQGAASGSAIPAALVVAAALGVAALAL